MNADNDSSAGRLDLLLQDPDAPSQHEAEILLANPALSERSGTSPSQTCSGLPVSCHAGLHRVGLYPEFDPRLRQSPSLPGRMLTGVRQSLIH